MRVSMMGAALLVAACGAASAESLICHNPGREYNLVFEPGAGVIVINPDGPTTTWPVLSRLQGDAQQILVVDLGQEGMTGQVHLSPYKKVEIFSKGELVQTDACHSAAASARKSPAPTSQIGPVFKSFESEVAAVTDLTRCARGKVTRTSGLPDLWGCVAPGAEVLKLFVNEGQDGGVANVKLMWNDWTRDVGYGVHTDRRLAMAWASALATRYAPLAVKDIMRAFEGDRAVTIPGEGYVVHYSYDRGSAIDERLLTITSD